MGMYMDRISGTGRRKNGEAKRSRRKCAFRNINMAEFGIKVRYVRPARILNEINETSARKG